MPASRFEFHDVVVDGNARPRLAIERLVIDPAGVTVLSGPSGAGKSTLLRLCNRLDVPDRGRVRYADVDLDELDPRQLRRRVGMVFQRPTLFPGTVADNLRVARPEATDAEMVEVLDRVGLAPEFLDRVGDQLSGGEAQRACLARTLLTQPEVLLLDEPTSSLDETAARRLEDTVRTLVVAGVVAIWVSHDSAQVGRMADHLVRLDGGRVVG